MSRPGSSAHSIGSFHQEEGPVAGPSRSPSHDFHAQHQIQHQQYHHIDASGAVGGGWDGVEGRLVYPMNGHPAGVISVVGPNGLPLSQPIQEDDEGDFLPMDEEYSYMGSASAVTPFHAQNHAVQPAYFQGQMHHGGQPIYHVSPPMHPHPHAISTSPTAMMGHGMPLMQIQSPNDAYRMQTTPVPQGYYVAAGPPRRPGMQHRHSAMPMGQRPQMQRQYSLQPPPSRVIDPIGHDVFAMPPGSTPIRRAASAVDEFTQDPNQFLHTLPQGISPARALGPAPTQRPHFSPSADPLITPQTKQFPHIPSSASSALTDSSTLTSGVSSVDRRRVPTPDTDEEENESPTRASKGQLQQMSLEEVRRPAVIAPVRLKTVIGGRTSAKFAKVAEDPGVEGVPPGPRPAERPTPSFACIIGQAILRCSAGGLSLEHIYRYVETAYPFFKSGDPAWRNSVRHNLSIHKMFETIPRTEHYPPGKGGIWIIHEEEKIHWPSEDKFIKNFPPSHPHHACCRQTLHEKLKENEAIAKARAEGREYVPKKGKKGRKAGGEDGGADMIRTNSAISDGLTPAPQPHQPLPMTHTQPVQMMSTTVPMHMSMQMQQQPPPGMFMIPHPPVHPNPPVRPVSSHTHPHPHGMPMQMQMHQQYAPHQQHQQQQPEEESTTPKMPLKIIHPPPFMQPHQSLNEDSFELMDEHEPHGPPPPPPLALPRGTMVPPRFGHKRPFEAIDEENVFTTGTHSSAPKRVRMTEPLPLAPIHSNGQETDELDDAYVTPERAGQINNKILTTASSSTFKTPALAHSSSSPGSSPMPPTILRTTQHHPSALQQTWTQEDVHGASDNSPSHGFSLDAAFDIKPKMSNGVASKRLDDMDAPHSPRGPPKTPLTRSSAANMHRTPFNKGTSAAMQTPMMYAGSPTLPRLPGYEISTPAWEMEGILDRLGVGASMSLSMSLGMGTTAGGMGMIFSPLRSPSLNSASNASASNGGVPLGLRSPLTSTDPSKYATRMHSGEGSGGSSPTKMTGSSLSLSMIAASGASAAASPTRSGVTLGKALLSGAAAAGIKDLVKAERERTRTRSGENKVAPVA